MKKEDGGPATATGVHIVNSYTSIVDVADMCMLNRTTTSSKLRMVISMWARSFKSESPSTPMYDICPRFMLVLPANIRHRFTVQPIYILTFADGSEYEVTRNLCKKVSNRCVPVHCHNYNRFGFLTAGVFRSVPLSSKAPA